MFLRKYIKASRSEILIGYGVALFMLVIVSVLIGWLFLMRDLAFVVFWSALMLFTLAIMKAIHGSSASELLAEIEDVIVAVPFFLLLLCLRTYTFSELGRINGFEFLMTALFAYVGGPSIFYAMLSMSYSMYYSMMPFRLNRRSRHLVETLKSAREDEGRSTPEREV